MNRIDEMLSSCRSGGEYARAYVQYLSQLLLEMDFKAIDETIRVLLQAGATGKTIFFVGNGGSAATCSHFAEDLAYGIRRIKNFKAVSLTTNTAYLTAIGNDEGYENVFVRQLENLLGRGDVVVGISVSGNSPNVVKAMEYANSSGGVSVGIIGFDGGKMKGICQHSIAVKTLPKEYAPAEDIHLVLGHIMSSYLQSKIDG